LNPNFDDSHSLPIGLELKAYGPGSVLFYVLISRAKSEQDMRSSYVLGAAAAGAAVLGGVGYLLHFQRTKSKEPTHAEAHAKVWSSIGGAMQASQIYLGDRLGLYAALRNLCQPGGTVTGGGGAIDAIMGTPDIVGPRVDGVTAQDLASAKGLNVRWIREWMAQQAAMGILTLLEGEGDDDLSLRYHLASAYSDVLANPSSPEYDISMIQLVPALVNRAKTALPEAFKTGKGLPYDEDDVAEAINRHHEITIRDNVIPVVVPMVKDGSVQVSLEMGIKVADLGCGGGNLILALARKFPNSEFHGYEVSDEALSLAATSIATSQLTNVFVHDAKEKNHSLGDAKSAYDLVTTFDVLHDAPNPAELISQVKAALRPEGTWLLADMAGEESVRENIKKNPSAATMWAFSTCLCMSCSLSGEDNGDGQFGAGLGTLGFTISVAQTMLTAAGFSSVEVLYENGNTRWFQVSH